MTLEDTWAEIDHYLWQISLKVKELRQQAGQTKAVSEPHSGGACILEEIDLAERELIEALRLSRSARDRIRNLFSDRRKKP